MCFRPPKAILHIFKSKFLFHHMLFFSTQLIEQMHNMLSSSLQLCMTI
uniref:Uncharacterized protein n=1 Tax=Arundo donax TaxID=35708 RepID=A0A0A9D4L9_ARUDO